MSVDQTQDLLILSLQEITCKPQVLVLMKKQKKTHSASLREMFLICKLFSTARKSSQHLI